MADRLQEQLRRWLDAERAPEGAVAERALRALFQSLPQAAPQPGFALRVVAGARLARRPPPVAPALLRWAAGAVLLVAGAAAVAVPVVLHRFLGDLSVAGGMERLTEAVGAASRWLAAGLGVWQKAAALAGELLATPEAAAGALASVLLAALALRLLTSLITRERQVWYASP